MNEQQVDTGKRPVVIASDVELPLFAPSAGNISILGRHFIDDKGRVLLLRGANVSASSKV